MSNEFLPFVMRWKRRPTITKLQSQMNAISLAGSDVRMRSSGICKSNLKLFSDAQVTKYF